MKYRVLITGKNKMIIEDLFTHFWSEFECLSCSNLYEDIKNHLKYITPDALICCLLEEDMASARQVASLKKKLHDKNISLILVGSKEDCNTFTFHNPNLADLIIEKPISSNQISDQIVWFIERKRRIEIEKGEAAEEDFFQDSTKELLKEIEDFGKRKHVLVVDDDPIMLKLIKEHLHETYDVATAINGKVAMKFLSNKKTDLILLDYEMPGEDGPQVLEQLHNNEATKDIPVVFLTSIVDREKIQTALQLKPQGYLLKPIDQERLLQEIKKQLG